MQKFLNISLLTVTPGKHKANTMWT